MVPDFLFVGPVIYSRDACNDIGNQAEYFGCAYGTLDLERVTGNFLLDA